MPTERGLSKIWHGLQGVSRSGKGSEGSQQVTSAPQGWCCIIFVHRKMTSVALHAILRMTPALGFLASAPFMGYGGSTNATSLNARGGSCNLPWDIVVLDHA